MAGPLKDPELRRLRALRMIEMRIKGKTLAEVAQEFNLSERTVAATLSWAKKAELVVQAEDRILQELVPAATEALRAVLAGTNDEVKAKTALDIFKGTLPSFAKGKPNAGTATVSDGGSLASYIDQLRNELISDGDVVSSTGGALPDGAEGSARALIPATAESVGAEGLSVSTESDVSPADEERNAADIE